jgi:hypothetical protein
LRKNKIKYFMYVQKEERVDDSLDMLIKGERVCGKKIVGERDNN